MKKAHFDAERKGTIVQALRRTPILSAGLSGMIGQPRRFILTGEDKLPIAMGEVVPFPASGNGGECSIEAVLLGAQMGL